ncbi:hypothetical protein G1C96_0056 [Bifidobacterium sp. DSM 109958]|uniref:Uncharacterized protein n=1 Tax=Bifidobacterium moraviense TaxID=2675323 RepID=A0A7Y0EZX3_9BIFI|nr:hypothetical protein [Bifidobacterium sp. DSM 109958]
MFRFPGSQDFRVLILCLGAMFICTRFSAEFRGKPLTALCGFVRMTGHKMKARKSCDPTGRGYASANASTGGVLTARRAGNTLASSAEAAATARMMPVMRQSTVSRTCSNWLNIT